MHDKEDNMRYYLCTANEQIKQVVIEDNTDREPFEAAKLITHLLSRNLDFHSLNWAIYRRR